MRLSMNDVRGVRIGGLDQTEDLSGPLVYPIVDVADVVLVLDLQIRLVRLGHILRGCVLGELAVDIHEERHRHFSSPK
jgi:hypothetical protein